jgi:hypothetical protein
MSKFTDDSDPMRVARWALRAIWQVAYTGYVLPAGYSIKHIGRCGRCGNALTHPASLDTGFGPDCAEALGIDWREIDRRQPELEGVANEEAVS